MKKRFFILLAAVMMMGSLCACTSNVTKYKANEEDKYFLEAEAHGGNKQVTGSTVEKVWLTRWLGSEKLVMDFYEEGTRSMEIPYYTISFNDAKTFCTIELYHCALKTQDFPAPADSKYLREFSVKQDGDNVIIKAQLHEDLKFRIDEISTSGQLVLNIKKLT